jgi:hypothetical protein
MICSKLELTAAPPYALTFSPGASGYAGSTLGDAPVAVRCPAGQAIVAFEGRSGLLLDRLSFQCAPPVVGPGPSVGLGPTSDLPPLGGGGGSSFPRAECEPGTMARGVVVSQGIWLERIGLQCAKLDLR